MMMFLQQFSVGYHRWIQWTVFSQIIEQMWLFDKKPKDFSYLHQTRGNLIYNRHPFIHMGRCFQVYRLFTKETPNSYLPELSWGDHDLLSTRGLSMCCFTVWLLFRRER